MEFRQLEAFVAVYDLQSFSKAAEYLYLSQPTISSHINNLEKELKVKLISRTTKSLHFTDEGITFLSYAKRILELKNAALNDLQSNLNTGIQLGASTIPSGYLLPPVLNAFHQENPQIYFNIRQGDSREIEERILDGTVELGLTGQLCTNPQCVCIPFCSDQLVIATPTTPYYTELKESKATTKRLLKEPLIMREQGSATQRAADYFFKNLRIPSHQLQIVARINDLESIKRMIVNGMGISILSKFAIADLEQSQQIFTYPLATDVPRQFYIIHLKNRPLKTIAKQFIQFTQDFYRNHL
jgi:DNA-binding transcriptional LysR family regulator